MVRRLPPRPPLGHHRREERLLLRLRRRRGPGHRLRDLVRLHRRRSEVPPAAARPPADRPDRPPLPRLRPEPRPARQPGPGRPALPPDQPDRTKVAAALVLTAPFIPMLFQGEEFAASAPFQYFADFSDDPDLARGRVRGAAEGVRPVRLEARGRPRPRSPGHLRALQAPLGRARRAVAPRDPRLAPGPDPAPPRAPPAHRRPARPGLRVAPRGRAMAHGSSAGWSGSSPTWRTGPGRSRSRVRRPSSSISPASPTGRS